MPGHIHTCLATLCRAKFCLPEAKILANYQGIKQADYLAVLPPTNRIIQPGPRPYRLFGQPWLAKLDPSCGSSQVIQGEGMLQSKKQVLLLYMAA
jgi:hypothetical protein